jgi:hypothetical protein
MALDAGFATAEVLPLAPQSRLVARC